MISQQVIEAAATDIMARAAIDIPEDYRATVHSGTVNGGFNTDIPFTVQGRLRSRRLTAELNGGGQPIRVVTTNGSVRIRSR